MNRLITLTIILILFLGVSVLYTLGLKNVNIASSSFVDNITPGFFTLIICFILLIIEKKIKIKKTEWALFLFTIIYLFLKTFLFKQPIYLAIICNVFIGPVILLIILRQTQYPKSKVINLLILCFFTECFCAIIQRLLGYSFLVMPNLDLTISASYESGDFRSVSMYGHYLQGALFATTIMSFIYIAKTSFTKKLLLLTMGFLAILCFNTRSSMAYWGVLLALLIMQKMFSSHTPNKEKVLCVLYLVGMLSALSYLIAAGWGGRLISMSLYDESSAEARVTLFRVFHFLNTQDILWGISLQEVARVMQQSEVFIIENYWVLFILYLGLIPTIIFTILTILCLKDLFKRFTYLQTAIPVFSFLIISSTNNSMATNIPVLFIFVLFAYSVPLETKKLAIKNNV